ncbi:MAG: hypothetical protein FJZ98_09590 [Chloroflexi bacterium]|nr:hypothetical protein [Chloroflexota bacterium]
MKTIEKYKNQQRMYAQLFLIAGIVCTGAGVAIETTNISLGIDPRLITGLGILLLGLSLSAWLRFYSAEKRPQTTQRMVVAESDERMTAIKNKAGQRGFWTSMAIIYGLLMWESISSNDSLPILSADARWYWLAAAVVLPMAVYIGSIVQGNRE